MNFCRQGLQSVGSWMRSLRAGRFRIRLRRTRLGGGQLGSHPLKTVRDLEPA